jgi:hypothetical protein
MIMKFRVLDRITVTNFIEKVKEAKIGKINDDEYYLLDDPSVYELKELGDGYYTFSKDIPYRVYDFADIKELYSEYVNQQLGNSLNVFKVLLHYKEGKLSTERLNERLRRILDTHKDIPDDILADLSNMLEELSVKYHDQRIVVDPSILEAVKYYLEMMKANPTLAKVSVREFLLKVKYYTEKDRVEFPIASDLIAEIEALIDMLKKEEKEKEKKREGEKKERKVGKKKKEEITVGAGGSSMGSDSDTDSNTDTDDGSSSDKEGNEGSNESKNEGSTNAGSSSSGTDTRTVGETDIPLPYLDVWETYVDIPWTENDKNEIVRMFLNYAQLRGRRCKVRIR